MPCFQHHSVLHPNLPLQWLSAHGKNEKEPPSDFPTSDLSRTKSPSSVYSLSSILKQYLQYVGLCWATLSTAVGSSILLGLLSTNKTVTDLAVELSSPYHSQLIPLEDTTWMETNLRPFLWTSTPKSTFRCRIPAPQHKVKKLQFAAVSTSSAAPSKKVLERAGGWTLQCPH